MRGAKKWVAEKNSEDTVAADTHFPVKSPIGITANLYHQRGRCTVARVCSQPCQRCEQSSTRGKKKGMIAALSRWIPR